MSEAASKSRPKNDVEDTRVITVTLDAVSHRNLRVLAAELDVSAPDLIREATEYWWGQKHQAEREHALSEPAPAKTSKGEPYVKGTSKE